VGGEVVPAVEVAEDLRLEVLEHGRHREKRAASNIPAAPLSALIIMFCHV
jgi:hypothetical protein